MAWSAKVVEVDATNTVVRTLVNCNIGEVPMVPLNPRGETFCPITIPKHEVGSAVGQYDDIRLGREIQIFDGASLKFQGVPMKRQARSSDGAITIPVYDLGWYLTKANIDAPVRDLLTNGTFEAGTTGWTAVGCTMTVDSSRVRRGSASLKLVGTSTFAEQYIKQTVAVTGTGVGTALTVRAHFNIDAWTGPAIYSRGLFIQSSNGGTVETFNDHAGVIDDDTALALDEWQRLEADTWVPPLAARTIEVRFYVGNATIYVDEIGLFKPTSLAIAPGAGEDIATTANRIVSFVQDSAYSKSTKHITQTTAPTTGIKFYFPKSWQYADHTPADTALDEIVKLGVDYSIATTTTTKTFTVHYPQKGVTTPSVTLTFPAGNVASYEFDEDYDAVETAVTVLGEGEGPDREEGYAYDALDVDGMVLQGLESVPPGTTVDKLDPLADSRLALRKRPVVRLTMVTKGAVSVATGDLVTLAVSDGVISLSGSWRVIEAYHLPKTDGCLRLVLNDTAESLVLDGDDVTPTSPTTYDGGSATTESFSVVDGGEAA